MAHALTPAAVSVDLSLSEEPLLNLSEFVQQLFTDIRDVAQIIAPLAAVIGFLGLGLLYMGSSWPIIGDWKKDNPKAANQVVIGLLFVIFASSVTTLITFSGP
jgi:choline-glycine betaine transporter